jgi:hypothetical protein
MGTLNEDFTQSDGNRLREKAQYYADLIRFMLQNADAAVWARVDDLGFSPPTFAPPTGDWVVAMNQHRIKRAATKAEAEEIVRLVQVRYGDDSESILEWLRHAVFDPLWALRNLRVMAGETGLTATTSDGVGEI